MTAGFLQKGTHLLAALNQHKIADSNAKDFFSEQDRL
jgi:hypothetical protein